MTTNPEERARELPSKVGLERELHRAWSKQSRCLGCSKPAELLWPIVKQWLTQARDAGFKDGAEWKRISAGAIRQAALEEAVQFVKKWNFMACSDVDGLMEGIRALAQAAAPAKGDK